jgi:hypothetical protein
MLSEFGGCPGQHQGLLCNSLYFGLNSLVLSIISFQFDSGMVFLSVIKKPFNDPF